MTSKEMETRILNLETQFKNLASRPYTQRSEEAKAKAITVETDLETLDKEVAESTLALAETMLDMSMEIEELTKGV